MDRMKSSNTCSFFDRRTSGDWDSLRTRLFGIRTLIGQVIFSSPELASPAMAPTQPTAECELLHFPSGKVAGALS